MARLYSCVFVVALCAVAGGWLYWQGRQADRLQEVVDEKETLERINDAIGTTLDDSAVDDSLRDLSR